MFVRRQICVIKKHNIRTETEMFLFDGHGGPNVGGTDIKAEAAFFTGCITGLPEVQRAIRKSSAERFVPQDSDFAQHLISTTDRLEARAVKKQTTHQHFCIFKRPTTQHPKRFGLD